MSSVFDINEDKSEYYDLSPIVDTLKVAKIKKMKNSYNLMCQMEKVLKELSIVENSNFYDKEDINSFYNMLENTN